MPKKQPLYPHVPKSRQTQFPPPRAQSDRLKLTGRGKAEAEKLTRRRGYLGEAFVYPALALSVETEEIDPEMLKARLGLSDSDVADVIQEMIKKGLVSKPTWFE